MTNQKKTTPKGVKKLRSIHKKTKAFKDESKYDRKENRCTCGADSTHDHSDLCSYRWYNMNMADWG